MDRGQIALEEDVTLPENTPNGTFASGDQLTVEDTVRVPETASEGDTFGIDGSVRLGDAETDVGGTDTLTVSESDGSQSDGETAGGDDTSSAPTAEFSSPPPWSHPSSRPRATSKSSPVGPVCHR